MTTLDNRRALPTRPSPARAVSHPAPAAPLARAAALLLLCTLSPACGPSQAEHSALADQLAKTRSELDRYRRDTDSELRELAASALCRPETRDLLDLVRENLRRCAERPGGTARPQTDTCTNLDVQPAVMRADPSHRGRFLSVMNGLRHEAFYLQPNRKGSYTPAPERLQRLSHLVQVPWLRTTQFLIVVHPVPGEPDEVGEANRRAEVLVKWLTDEKHVPKERLWRWIYAFPVTNGEISRSDDLPLIGEPHDLNRGVWVFRADC